MYLIRLLSKINSNFSYFVQYITPFDRNNINYIILLKMFYLKS